jgi:hypothetical protein
MSQVIRITDASNAALSLIQREFPNYHPLLGLARLAHKQEVIRDSRLEFDVHKALLPYVSPRLATIEVKSENSEDRRVVVSLFEEKTLENGSIVETEIPLITDVSDLYPLDE